MCGDLPKLHSHILLVWALYVRAQSTRACAKSFPASTTTYCTSVPFFLQQRESRDTAIDRVLLEDDLTQRSSKPALCVEVHVAQADEPRLSPYDHIS